MASVGNAVLPLRGLLYIVRHRVFPVQTNFMPVALNAAGSLAFLLALYTKCVPQISINDDACCLSCCATTGKTDRTPTTCFWMPTGAVRRGWSLQRPVVYGALGSGMLGFAALQALLAVEAGAAVYAVLQRTLASASTSMFDAASLHTLLMHDTQQNSRGCSLCNQPYPLVTISSTLPVPKLQPALCCAQVLAARGVKQVKQFSTDELDDIRAAAGRERQQQQRQVQQLGLPARLLRFAIRQVGKRLVTAPLMLIPGAVQPKACLIRFVPAFMLCSLAPARCPTQRCPLETAGVGWAAYVYTNAMDEGALTVSMRLQTTAHAPAWLHAEQLMFPVHGFSAGASCHQAYFRRKVPWMATDDSDHDSSSTPCLLLNSHLQLVNTLLWLQGVNDELMRKAIVSSRSQEYTAFGAAALVLNLIPVGGCTTTSVHAWQAAHAPRRCQCHNYVLCSDQVLNYFLSFGNAAGAALWAADVEVPACLMLEHALLMTSAESDIGSGTVWPFDR
jgi:hypothetical protein